MAKTDEQEATKSGITTNAVGSRHIPASVRADGSVRKEIKIRPGYRPPEDIEKYKNRTAEAFRNRGKGGVLGAELVDDSKSKEQSASAAKNAKRREARKKAAAEKKDGEEEEADKLEGSSNGVKAGDEQSQEIDPEAAKQKEVKKLVKKLRQAKELKDKKESGAALLPEQFEKVIKINELIRQLDALGFNAEGEKKQGDADVQAVEDP